MKVLSTEGECVFDEKTEAQKQSAQNKSVLQHASRAARAEVMMRVLHIAFPFANRSYNSNLHYWWTDDET